MTKIIVLLNKTLLISKIEEVGSELGEPDCKLVDPYVVEDNGTISPWLFEYTTQNSFMIHSDKIITIVDPKKELLDKYNSLL
jgi:hypothetical protein